MSNNTAEKIIVSRMRKINAQYISELGTQDIVDMMEEFASQFKVERKELTDEAWVDTAERLPENKEEVLCIHKWGRMVQQSWEECTDQNAEWFKKNFTYWRKLPPHPIQQTSIQKPSKPHDTEKYGPTY